MRKIIKRVIIWTHVLIPFFACMLFFIIILVGDDKGGQNPKHETGMLTSNEVQRYAAAVYESAEKNDIRDYGNYMLAIMQVETQGIGVDVMQSLVNSGFEEDEKTPGLSIEYGCKYFTKLLRQAKDAGCDIETAIQAYNYGDSYIDFVAANGKEHSFALAVNFAARRSGGKKIVYNNDIAVHMNGGWRYDYGNMFYVYLVKQYLAAEAMSGEKASAVIQEALKYKGWEYVWGGSSPATSFDCSGLVQYCYGTVDIFLPRTAQEQYNVTQHITLEEAQPGDLVFFTGTTDTGSYITHVGIYVGNEKMFHAGNPIGYGNLTSNYYKKHFVCAGRIK